MKHQFSDERTVGGRWALLVAVACAAGLIARVAVDDEARDRVLDGAVVNSPSRGTVDSSRDPRGEPGDQALFPMGRREALRKIDEFEAWRVAHLQSAGMRRGGDGIGRRAGVELARERREAMRWMIRRDPERALEAAVPRHERDRLPAAVAALLEEPISGAGAFEVVVACPEPGQPAVRLPSAGPDGMARAVVLEDGRRFDAFVYGRRLDVTTKDRLSLHGIAIDGDLAVDESPVRAVHPDEAANPADGGAVVETFGRIERLPDDGAARRLEAALVLQEAALGPGEVPLPDDGADGGAAASPWTEGPKRILYVRVRFSDDDPAAEPLAESEARAHQDRVAEYFRICSYGKVDVETVITGVVTLPDTHASYRDQALGRMMDDALAGALLLGQAAGEDWDAQNFDFHTVVSRGGIGSYAGLAQVGGRKAHLQSFSLRTAGHEYGHNFGLPHAFYNYTAALDPGGQDPVHGEAPAVEYGHRFSIMSAQSGSDFNNPALPVLTVHEKSRLDWLEGSGIAEVAVPAAGGTVRLQRNDAVDATGTQAIRLPASSRGTNNARYWVSYRGAWAPPDRGSANAALDRGAVVDWTRESGGPSTQIDLTPYSDDGSHTSSADYLRDNDDKWDAALLPGRTFSDVAAGVHLTCLGAGGSGAGKYVDVHVHVDGWDETELVGESAPCRARVPDAGTAAGTAWTFPAFDDSAWPIAGPLGIGYERSSGYEDFIGTDVGPVMDRTNTSLHVRIPFVVPDASALDGIEQMALRIRYDDGFVAYLNGIPVAQANAPADLGWNAAATAGHADSEAVQFAEFTITGAAALLTAGTNVLAVHGLNDGTSSSDFLIQPVLVLRRPGAVNRPPTVSLAVETDSLAVGQPGRFTVEAADPDGDELAYAWEFDGGTGYDADAANAATVTKAWQAAGVHVVAITVSDRRGGIARDHVVVRVGDPDPAGPVAGRILRDGRPLAGARVWSGDAQCRSDSEGRYALAGLGPGTIRVHADFDGHVLVPLVTDLVDPATSPSGIDFAAFEDGEADDGGAEVGLSLTPDAAVVAPGGTIPLRAFRWDRSADAEEVVPWGAAWKFLDDGSDPGASWATGGFDDAGWSEGAAPLGYGDGSIVTTVDDGGDASNRHVTTYFRRRFVVADLADVVGARLEVVRDDGVVVRVNGTEVLRDNFRPGDSVGAGRLAFNDVSGTGESTPLVVGIPRSLLVEGTNTVAVEVHQASVDSNDLIFDLRLAVRRHVRDVTAGAEWSVAEGVGTVAGGLFVPAVPGDHRIRASLDGWVAEALITVPGDVSVEIEAVDPVAMERDASAGLLRIRRDGDLSAPLAVRLGLFGSAVPGADVSTVPAEVTIPAGSAVLDLEVAAIDDREAEGRESLFVSILSDGSYATGPASSAAIHVEDDDVDPAPVASIEEPAAATEAAVGAVVDLRGSANAGTVFIAMGDAWRYLDDGSEPSAAWHTVGFDDTSWKEGMGEFGYGDGDEFTVVDDGGEPQQRHVTTYFRKTFAIADSAGLAAVRGWIVADDGAVVRVNGIEVFRLRMPGGSVNSTTLASSTASGDAESQPNRFDVDPSVLSAGLNVVAVEVHQSARSSSDVSFDLSMEADFSADAEAISYQWDLVDGEGDAVEWGDRSLRATTVRFLQAGMFSIRLSADDGANFGSAERTVTVVAPVHPFDAWMSVAGASLDAADRLPLADGDGDGIDNLREFAFVLDPAAPDPAAGIELAGVDPCVVRYRRIRGAGVGEATDYAVSGIRYVLEASLDGMAWEPVGAAGVEAGEPIDNGDGSESAAVEVDSTVVLRLIRLRVVLAPAG